MSEELDRARLDVLALLPTCTQCGNPFSEQPCGFAHLGIFSDPLMHVIFEPLTTARDKAAYRAGYLDAEQGRPSAFPKVQPRDKRRKPA